MSVRVCLVTPFMCIFMVSLELIEYILTSSGVKPRWADLTRFASVHRMSIMSGVLMESILEGG